MLYLSLLGKLSSYYPLFFKNLLTRFLFNICFEAPIIYKKKYFLFVLSHK